MPNTNYLKSLTDDFGVWQHSSLGVITKSEGYALDDSARALIVFLLYKDFEQAEVCLNYLEISNRDKSFVGFFTQNRKPIESTYPSSEDSFNLAFMALAYCVSVDFNKYRAEALIKKLDVKLSKYTKALSYKLIAECYLNNQNFAEQAAMALVEKFNPENNWFEEYLTYANAVIPLSLLMFVNKFSIHKQIIDPIILESFNTLEHNMRIGVIPSPQGNLTQHKVGARVRDIYGQQPIDAAFMVLMYNQAYEYFKDEMFLKRSKEWLSWFDGNNIWQKSLVKEDSACADGLDTQDISANYGAESTIMWLWCALS